MQISSMMRNFQIGDDKLGFLKAVKAAFEYNRIKYHQFLKLLKDLRAGGRIDTRGVMTKVKRLFKGHTDLILGLNTFLPTGKKVGKSEEKCELPLDVLDITCKTLDFDDLFQFSGVCKNWRSFHKFYWRNFLASQGPLLLQKSPYVKNYYSFISIPDQKVYNLEMMNYFIWSRYVTYSSGYFILEEYNNSFLLINPFTRIKKVISFPTSISTSEGNFSLTSHALLAFSKCAEEFVFVVLCKQCLHVYQSRNCGWVTYSTKENREWVVDLTVLHDIIYVITNMANIGVLSLNSANIKFLKLRSTPTIVIPNSLKLVICDEQLLVVYLLSKERIIVYKIDFSTMNYVKLKTLGDIALFSISIGLMKKCYALSNPNKWGYDSNSVYYTSDSSTICSVYLGDDKKLQKCITLPAPLESHPTAVLGRKLDWCFRHLKYEVDYSLVE